MSKNKYTTLMSSTNTMQLTSAWTFYINEKFWNGCFGKCVPQEITQALYERFLQLEKV